MEIYLTHTEIENECIHIKERIKHLFPHYYTHIQLMFYFGLRISETLLTDGYEKDKEGNLNVYMSKTNSVRLLRRNDFIDNLNIEYLMIMNSFQSYNIKSLERAIKFCSSYRRLYVGNKGLNSHIFRHNFAKKQFEIFQSEASVQAVMGEKTLKATNDYIYSKIYYYGNKT